MLGCANSSATTLGLSLRAGFCHHGALGATEAVTFVVSGLIRAGMDLFGSVSRPSGVGHFNLTAGPGDFGHQTVDSVDTLLLSRHTSADLLIDRSSAAYNPKTRRRVRPMVVTHHSNTTHISRLHHSIDGKPHPETKAGGQSSKPNEISGSSGITLASSLAHSPGPASSIRRRQIEFLRNWP